MSTAQAKAIVRAGSFYQDAIGKKAVVAVTGVILFGYVVGHLAGNLQIFMGREAINRYAEFLHGAPVALWSVRLLLLAAVGLHIAASVQLTKLQRAARPVRYSRWTPIESSYASRTMMWSGPIIAAFVVYHVLHLTTGTVHPSFDASDVHQNLIAGFSSVPASIAYLVAVVLLGLHLRHGLWSMLHSMGVSHPRHTPRLKQAAVVVAVVIVLGYASIPVAVLTGLIE